MSTVAEPMAKMLRQQQDYTRFDSFLYLYIHPHSVYLCIYIYMYV